MYPVLCLCVFQSSLRAENALLSDSVSSLTQERDKLLHERTDFEAKWTEIKESIVYEKVMAAETEIRR